MNIEPIWQEYHTALHHFIQSRVGDVATTDDILQEVFVKIHTRIDTLKENTKIQSWIYQITRNAIIDHFRSQKMTEELSEELSEEYSTAKIDDVEKARQEIEACLLPMIKNLPVPYHQAIMLSEIDGITQKQLAEKQGISLSGAKSRVQRGRSMVKNMLLTCCHFQWDHKGRLIDYEEQNKNSCPC